MKSPSITPTVRKEVRMKFSNLCVVISILAALGAPQAIASPDSLTASNQDSTKQLPGRKSVVVGIAVSIVPGIIYHGFGNMYAESRGVSLGLLGAEVAGIALFAVGMKISLDHDHIVMFGGNHGGSHSWIGTPLIYAGSALFIGSWVADVVTTPIAVSRYNARIDQERAKLSMGLRSINGKPAMIIGISYSF
jgi:hypothetical protein